jgi:hypothetical protein
MANERQPLLVTPEEAHQISTVIRRVLNMRGLGVTNSPDGITINPPPPVFEVHSAPPNDLFIVKVTGNRTGGGQYAGKIVRAATSTLSYTGNLSASEIADDTGAPDCTIINPHEQSQSTHAITASTQICSYFTAVKTGQVDESGLPVLRIIDGFDMKSCS